MGVKFIPQVIYEHGEPWWNDVDRGKLLTHPPELSGSHTSTVISCKAGGMGKRNENSALQIVFVHIFKCFLDVVKTYDIFTSPLKEGVLQIFIALTNPSPWPGPNPQTLGANGMHTNHYITKAT
jgi:hypothetical protein